MAKHWLIDIPPEIRLRVYKAYFQTTAFNIHLIYDNVSHEQPDRPQARKPGAPWTLSELKQRLQGPGRPRKPERPWALGELKQCALLWTCKRIRSEAYELFFSEAEFHFKMCRCWLKAYGRRGPKALNAHLAKIKHLVCHERWVHATQPHLPVLFQFAPEIRLDCLRFHYEVNENLICSKSDCQL